MPITFVSLSERLRSAAIFGAASRRSRTARVLDHVAHDGRLLADEERIRGSGLLPALSCARHAR